MVQNIVNDNDLSNCLYAILRRLLLDIAFIFIKGQREALLTERDDKACWRHTYYRKIRKLSKAGKHVIYTLYTWTNADVTRSKARHDTNIVTAAQERGKGLTMCKAPSWKGGWVILVHAGNEAVSFFIGKKVQTTMVR